MKMKHIKLVSALSSTLMLSGCIGEDVELKSYNTKVQYMAKSPYYKTNLQNMFGGDLVKLDGSFYTLVDANGYIYEGAEVKVTALNNEIKEVCQILIPEMQEFTRCFVARKV